MDGTTPPLLRVVKGDPTAEELAALTAVLLAYAARCEDGAEAPRRGTAAARWHRLERSGGFEGPRTWQSTRPGADRTRR